MPAVAIVADVVVTDVIGSAVAEAVGATVLGSTILASAIDGAIIGTVSGGITAAVEGQNIWKGMETGAIQQGIAAGVTNAFEGGTWSGSTETSEDGKMVAQGGSALLPTGLQTGTGDLGKALATGLGRTAGAAATGTPLGTALEEGAITGAVNYAIPGGGNTGGIERNLLSTGLQSVLGIGGPKAVRGGGSPLITGAASRQAGATPGSAALGAALGVADAGSPIFGSGGDDKKKTSGWNVQSLRYMGQPEESSGG